MAIQNGPFIQGRVGNLVYRIVNGRQIISQRPVPGTRKMSKKSINECNTFGMTTSLCSTMRKSIRHLLGNNVDTDMVNRLNAWMVPILKTGRDMKTLDYTFKPDSFVSIDGFEFNLHSLLSSMLPITVSDYNNDGIITVTLPAVSTLGFIRFPHDSYQCHVQVSMSYFRIWEGLTGRTVDTQSVILTKLAGNPEEKTFRFTVPDGCLCMVSVVLEYYKFRNGELILINRKNFQPASILKLFLTPGSYQNNDGRKWVKMIKFNRVVKEKAK